jgi:hypothetical protein
MLNLFSGVENEKSFWDAEPDVRTAPRPETASTRQTSVEAIIDPASLAFEKHRAIKAYAARGAPRAYTCKALRFRSLSREP